MFFENGVLPLAVVIFMFATKMENKSFYNSRGKECVGFDLSLAFICVKVSPKISSQEFGRKKRKREHF